MSDFAMPRPVCCEARDGHPVDPFAFDTLEEVRGFTAKRQGGGPNHVVFREPTGRFMCGQCARNRKRSGSAQQESIF